MGSGLYRPLAAAIHAVRVKKAREAGRPAPRLEETLFAVTLLNVVLCAEPLIGEPLRKSVALDADRTTRITSYNVCYTKLLRGGVWKWACMAAPPQHGR